MAMVQGGFQELESRKENPTADSTARNTLQDYGVTQDYDFNYDLDCCYHNGTPNGDLWMAQVVVNMDYDLTSIRDDLERIKSVLVNLEKQLTPELHTVKTTEEANNLFSHLTKMVELGNPIELIIRRL